MDYSVAASDRIRATFSEAFKPVHNGTYDLCIVHSLDLMEDIGLEGTDFLATVVIVSNLYEAFRYVEQIINERDITSNVTKAGAVKAVIEIDRFFLSQQECEHLNRFIEQNTHQEINLAGNITR
jgi:hypothetical protein